MNIKNKTNMKKTLLRIEQNKILRNKILSLSGIKSVLNVGSFPLENDKEGEYYKNYFKNVEYYTLDNSKGEYGPNHFNIDLHDLSLIKIKFDLILCMSVLEHVKNPFIVAKQLENISNKYLFIAVPFLFPLHQKIEKNFIDYWRFTKNGLLELFNKNFKEIWTEEMNSVIYQVKDKKNFWNYQNSKCGYAILFEKK